MSAGRATWSSLAKRTLGRFRAQFQDYFPPLLLFSAFGYVIYLMLERLSAQLSFSHSLSVMDSQPIFQQRLVYLVLRISIGLVEIWIPWLVFTFALATVVLKLLEERCSPESPMRLLRALRTASARRFGSLFCFSLMAGSSTALFSFVLLPILLRPLPLILMRFPMSTHTYLNVFQGSAACLVLLFAAVVTKTARCS